MTDFTGNANLNARRRLSVIIAACTLAMSSATNAAPAEEWLGGWAHSATAYTIVPDVTQPDGTTRPGRASYTPLDSYNNVTVREVLRLSVAARRVRIRFTNEFGGKALRIGAAHIALAGDNGAVVSGTDHRITFAGQASVEIPQGAPMLSDPIDWDLRVFATLSVSVYYPEPTVPPAHTLYTLNAWQAAGPGDQTGAATLPGAAPARSGVHISEIDVVPARPGQALVTFGDSITEGVASTVGGFRGWPDRLAERLQSAPATRGWSVVNAGIGSNRLLHDTPSTNALSRFDRDVLSVPGVKAVIVLLGVNDIQYSHRNPAEAVQPSQVIAAFRQLIIRAHARGVKIYGATITAFEGSGDYTVGGEADRQAMNAFIRSGAFDGVVDFDAVTRDPSRPTHLLASIESSGHLHPSNEGYAAMADSIDLSLFGANKAGK
jgi:lysophospholipase L1-like esterase